MKHKLTAAQSVVLSLACAWSSVGCLMSAFGLNVTQDAGIAVAWTLWALLCGLLFSRRKGAWFLLLPIAAAGFLLWRDGRFVRQLLSMLSAGMTVYDRAYGWGVPKILQLNRTAEDLPVGVLGMILILGVSEAVCRRKGNFLAVFLLILPLAACLVVTDTVPAVQCLFVLLLCIVLLLLTDSVRTESAGQGTRLMLFALVPTALALGILFRLYPQETYVNRSEQIREQLLSYALTLPEKFQASFSGFTKPQDEVELSSLSGQGQLDIPVAEVTAAESGTVYLRMQDYDRYTGTAWVSTQGRQENLSGTGDSCGMVMVQTWNVQSSVLQPSFPDGETVLLNGTKANTEDARSFSVLRRKAALGASPEDLWLQLPESAAERCRQLVRPLVMGAGDAEQAAQRIADYVRSSASYSRSTGSMNPDSTDFVLWFLEESDVGYCVHFATAAAVLLRSAGIPARYVTGYKAEAIGGHTVRVTSNDAHAWVEYYNARNYTWNILEATPADPNQLPTEPVTETMPLPETEPTAPTQTQPQPTLPPQSPEDQPPAEERTVKTVPMWPAIVLLGLAALLSANELQRLVRIRLRQNRQERGSANDQAAVRWRETCLLARLLGKTVPEQLLKLAEKARFSQHVLSEEELEVFAAYCAAARRVLQSRPIYQKLLYRYWYAVI